MYLKAQKILFFLNFAAELTNILMKSSSEHDVWQQEVGGACERWVGGVDGGGGEQVHSTNVGRQVQSREHLFLEPVNPALHPSNSS